MATLRCRRGYTLIDVVVVLTLISAAVGVVGPLTWRIVARYQLNSAAQMLSADLVLTRMTAIQANAVTQLQRVSNREYRASGRPRRLPSMVRFAAASTDSIAFNGLGAMEDGESHSFHLYSTLGESVDVRVYAGGGHEVVRP